MIPKGTLVEIGITVLSAGERAPQVPEDTARVDLKMRVKGLLTADSEKGEEAEIKTPVGRLLSGILIEANPPYTHNFGSPIPELIPIGSELRELLKDKEAGK